MNITQAFEESDRQQAIKAMEAKLKANQEKLDADEGGILALRDEEVTAAQFVSHAAAIQRQDPIRYMQIQRSIMKTFVKSQMIEGSDFGTIPGTDKPGLYKAGAERLLTLFNLRIRVELQSKVENYEKPLFAYDYKATVLNDRGQILAECEANCNSWETKYRFRSVKTGWATPQEKEAAIAEKNGKFILPNDKIFDQINTIKKMSQKRAIVGATILAVNASAFFGNLEAEFSHRDDLPQSRPTWDVVDGEVIEESLSVSDLNKKIIGDVAGLIGMEPLQIRTIVKSTGKERSAELTPEERDRVVKQMLVSWSMGQGVFQAPKHAEASYLKMLKESPEMTIGEECAIAWIAKVNAKKEGE